MRVQHWAKNFQKWAHPVDCPTLGRITCVHRSEDFTDRYNKVIEWSYGPGVLVIDIHSFVQLLLCNNGIVKNPAYIEGIQDVLCNHASIVVADRIDNIAGRHIFHAFRTSRRLATTDGTLYENLNDYLRVIDWITPKLLPTPGRDRNAYIATIGQGMYTGSNAEMLRTSFEAAVALHDVLVPRIHRLTINKFKERLPLRKDFVLTVGLTEFQRKTYDLYTSFLNLDMADSGKAVWYYMHVDFISYICTHPLLFYMHFPKSKVLRRILAHEPRPAVHLEAVQPDVEQAFFDLLCSVPDMTSTSLSNRILIVEKIVEESIKVGDKVFIITDSLETMDLVQHLLHVQGRSVWCFTDAMPAANTPQHVTYTEADVYISWPGGCHAYMYTTRANRVIILESTREHCFQDWAINQLHCLGQQKPLYVYRFMASETFEEILFYRKVFSVDLLHRIVDDLVTPRRIPLEWVYPNLHPQTIPGDEPSELRGQDAILDRIMEGDYSITGIRKIDLQI